jgi:hypothetical protein
MDALHRLEAKQLARAKARSRRRRVSLIRRRTIRGSLALFAIAWAIIFGQLVLGQDPALSNGRKVARGQLERGRPREAAPPEFEEVAPEPEAIPEFEEIAPPTEAVPEFEEIAPEPEPIITGSS